MSHTLSFLAVMKAQQRRQVWRLLAAAVAGAATAGASVLLLGLSGWFIAGSAAAGLGGVSAVMAFNYLLPSAAIRLLAIVRTGGRYAERLFGHGAAFKAMASFRTHVFQTLAMGRPEISLGFSTGDASSRLVQDVDAIEHQFVGRSAGPSAVLALIAGLGLAGLLGPWPVAVLCLGATVQTLGGRWLHRRLTEASSARAQTAIGRLKDSYNSLADAAPELICYAYADQAVDWIMENDAGLGRARTGAARGEAAVAALQALCMSLTAMGVILVAGRASAALVAMAALAAAAAIDAAAGLLRAAERRGAYLAAVSRLSELESHAAAAPVATLPATADLRLAAAGRSITARVGDRIAICGVSGVGKTRLLEELLKLRPTANSEIEIAGIPICQVSDQTVRALFAFLPQNAPVLSGSIAENLRLGHPEATDDDLWQALRTAELESRVAAMPDGLMTWTGRAGAHLSGGERRRLCLARALLRPAPWLLLDEPTEGLDPATEGRVVGNLEQRLDRTGQGLILVSHRLVPRRLCRRHLDVGTSEIRD